MTDGPALPTYAEMFGDAARNADESRSVYSPAAYLADLLQLVDDHFVDAAITRNRPGIREIPLDPAHTDTEVPYLDVVNDVLAQRLQAELGGDPYEAVRSMRYPLALPFSREDARRRRLLAEAGVAAEEFYRLFTPDADPDVVAREYLGLSPEEYAVVTTALPDEAAVKAAYGLADADDIATLQDVRRFLDRTGLDGPRLLALPGVTVSADGTGILVDGGPVPWPWFEQVNRFVRLADRSATPYGDLDLVLRTCCGTVLDAAALRILATVKHLHDATDLPADVVCALAAPMIAAGDLFDRTFNGPDAVADRAVLGPEVPEKYAGFTRLTCTGDLLDPRNATYRHRVATGTGLSEADLATAVSRFDAVPFEGELGVEALTLLFRISTFARVLELPVPDLLAVLEVLRRDPSIRKLDPFDQLIGAGSGEHDPFLILAGGSATDGLWLAEVLVALRRWMTAAGVGCADLVTMTVGVAGSPEDVTALDGLYQRFTPVLLTPAAFVSERFSERDAGVVHRVVTAPGGPVSERDARLVRPDEHAAGSTAYRALDRLAAVARDDLLGLGIEDRLLGKIFTNLVLRGYLKADGTLVEDRFPADAGGFRLAGDFTELAEELFAVVSQLRLDDAEETSDSPPPDSGDPRLVAPDQRDPASFFPSDLQWVEGLDHDDDAELYDNLVYNRYVDADGTVLRTDFFADDARAIDLVTDADLGDAGPAIWGLIRDRTARFGTDTLVLDTGIFAALALDAGQLLRLRENLRFNGHIDAHDAYVDKGALLALPHGRLDVALEFHPLRHAILDTIQDQIAAFRAEHHTFAAEAFREVARTAFAGLLAGRLRDRHGLDGRIPDDLAGLVADASAELDLGAEFGPADEAAVRGRLAAILASAARYRLDPAAATAAGLDDAEAADVIALLQATGDLTAELMVPEPRVPFFTDVHSALEFTADGLGDYTRDVFFLLHAVATQTAAAVSEITATVDRVAAAQDAALYAGLQDALGVAPAVVEVMCTAVCADALDALVAPVLLAGDPAGRVTAMPADRRFRLTYRRLAEFASVAAALGLDAVQAEIAFRDRDLVGKYPERLVLPPGVTAFDALLPSGDGSVYLFAGTSWWRYSATTYALLTPVPAPLGELSHRFADLARVDAAFVDASGGEWLVGRDGAGVTRTFAREGVTAVWSRVDRTWGAIRNTFTDPARIDTAFRDKEGKTYLFSGDQYVRYSGAEYAEVDPGYPRTIAGNWVREGLDAELPDGFRTSIDASFQGRDGVTYLFRDGRYLPGDAEVAGRWGTVRNAFAGAPRIDAAFTADGAQYLIRDDQVIRYTDGVEGVDVRVDEGYPLRLETRFPNLPVEFEGGVQAAFTDADGAVHLFRNGRTVALAPGDGVVTTVAERWGRLGDVLPSGTVDAAFVGLDGRTYLFSGDRYLRYSGSDYSAVDPGYPRAIAGDWGGMRTVTAAFVLDGATYLFGQFGPLLSLPVSDDDREGFAARLDGGDVPRALREALRAHGLAPVADKAVTGTAPEWTVATDAGNAFTVHHDGSAAVVTGVSTDEDAFYVRYSTSDYATPDSGHPRPMGEDNWWELPDALIRGESALDRIDAVFTGTDRMTYLFAGENFVVFDNRERWWSLPRSIATEWDSLPFERVDAAFVGADGRTYVFSGPRYVRFSGADYTRLDDRYPNDITTFWGTVPNTIARTGAVDAALVVDSPGGPRRTYLFAGGQYVRYTGDTPGPVVDDGYPRTVAGSLTGEPRFAHLTAPLDAGIDAAVADLRTVHLFSGGRWHAVSDTLYARYDGLLPETPGCVAVEDGSVLVEDASGWSHVGAIETGRPSRTPVRPRLLRAAPERFRSGLSAVLHGVDGNTYLFRGTSCFDMALGREYPAAQDWGRPRNTVAQRGVVDAGFAGLDGRTYVFSGDQFVVHSGSTYADVEIDGHPRPVAEHWAGLTGVAIAFVEGELTHLCEPAGVDGRFRYVVYSGADYAHPEPGYPQVVDAGVWGVPAQWRAEGFDRVSAVVVERGNRFLLSGTRYLQHTPSTGAWSFPHPLSRLWPGLPFGDDPVESAFTGADGATYLFSRGRFSRYDGAQASPAEPVGERWGRLRNAFADTSRTTLVDAAFVDRGTTYLFAGDQYVRYSGPGYQYVDEGYPKPVVALRQEECFANLPDAVENLLADRVAAGLSTVVDGVVADHRNTYLFVDRDCHVVSRSLTATYELGALGRVRNTLADTGRVDAAFTRDDHTFLFSGDQYVRYTGDRYASVDEGYPRAIEAGLPSEIGVAALPLPFADGIDAALDGADGHTYLFAGRSFLGDAAPQPQPVTGRWGRVRNGFDAGAIDAAFVSAAGRLYAFAGDQYVRYTAPDARLADDGYPRSIKDDWGDLPVEFERKIDGAFRFEERTYLLQGERYVRYSDPEHRRVDRLFPQLLAARWGRWVDHRLADLVAITRFRDLHNTHSDTGGGLAGVLTGAGTIPDPYAQLAAVFGWDVDELAWAVRHHAFLPAPADPAAHVDIDLVSRLVDQFALAARLGGTPSTIYTRVWRPVHHDGAATDPGAGDALHRMLVGRHTESDRPALERHLHQAANEATRDALVAAAVAHIDGVHSPDDLFDLLLIDVEMGGSGITSAVREAGAATQLFFHRYFLDLQPVTVRTTPGRLAGPAAVKEELKRWWAWMKNYRVWEANRKVYLYPENYIRPELRDTKTPAFAKLENDLRQGELTPDAVRRAYASYLDEYTEVSRLTIAGGFVQEAPPLADHAWDLVLFGRTKTDPRRFYYRRASFSREASRSAVWEPWAKVDVRIDSDRVYPVFAFDRVFVFWAGLEKIASTTPSGTFTEQSSEGGRHTYSHDAPATYTVRVYYSFHDLNGTWTPAQQLNMEPVVTETLEVSDIQLLVETSAVMPGHDAHDNIVVRCSYALTDPVTMDPVRRTVAYSLTAELFTQPATAAAFDDTGAGRFDSVFDEPVALDPFAPVKAAMLARHDALGGLVLRQLAMIAALQPQPVIPPPSVVMFNNPKESDTDRWFAFDYKGGSFLCKPAPLSSAAAFASSPRPIHHAGDRLPDGGRVDAGFTAPDGTNHFFDNTAHREVTLDASGHQYPARPTAERWWRTTAGFASSGVDAVVALGGHTFVFSGHEYARFTGDSLAVADPGYPATLRSNDDRLPRWVRVEAAFTGLDGTTYFFAGESFTDSGAPTRRRPVAERWGLKVEGTPAGTGIFETGRVTAAVVDGEHTFLVAGDRYVRYTGADYAFIDAGYPKALAGNPDGLPVAPNDVTVTLGGNRYAFDAAAGTYTVTDPAGRTQRRVTSDVGGGAMGADIVVDAAAVVGGHLFLVSGASFVRYTLGPDGSIPFYVDAGYPKASAVAVDALVVLGGALVVFSGDQYAIVPAGQELDVPVALNPIDGAWGNLPREFRAGVAGAVDTSDALYLLRSSRYVRYPKVGPDGTAGQLPYPQGAGRFEIVRLTTGTASTLNQRMFAGGVGAVLDVATQETAERPSFDRSVSAATVIRVRPDTVEDRYLPVADYLDFDSANGLYYWEIFFHAPLLIASALSAAQRFADAVTWFEYVFDPTRARDRWRFLPFRETDVEALVADALADLDALGLAGSTAGPLLEQLRVLVPVFAQERECQGDEGEVLRTVPAQVHAAIRAIAAPAAPAAAHAFLDLQEVGAILARLERRYELMVGGRQAALQRYLDDPFDPHAIAAMRTGAYRRAVVMAYVDNLIDWGDSLFREYSPESIDQARMLYVLAQDLLGPRPADLRARPMREVRNFGQLTHTVGEYDFLVRRAGEVPVESAAAVHASIAVADPDDPDGDSYFTIPENRQLADYWDKVQDRLTKIRSSLDILGVARPVPLFAPPLDPMALVRATAAGADLGAAAAATTAVTAPPFRFSFLLQKAQELTDRLDQFGNDLLAALEKRDAEALNLLQNGHDGGILALTRAIREAAVGSATATVAELAATRAAAQQRQAHYQSLIDGGQLPAEIAQTLLMVESLTANAVASALKLGSGIAHAFPQSKIGLFNFGMEIGGEQVGSAIDKFADFAQTLAGTFSGAAEILGVQAGHLRTTQDWQLQLQIAAGDVAQITAQQDAAAHQLASAQRDLEVLQQDIANNAEVARFLTGKFGTSQLYDWMSGRLSALYFQAYGMARDLARQAELALRFERGIPVDPPIIAPVYWDGRHNGLLAAEQLGLDLQRLSAAHRDAGERGLEITKRISLLDLDPIALLGLRATGRCEFSLTEALFDHDFPGHHRRQIRTLSVTLAGPDGQPVPANAMLTQLQHKTVLAPDAKAVKHLLDGQGAPPSSVRSDWRPTQQIALSQVPDGQENNGLFELRFDDDRYLPFEGTGAVSTWRLELPGRHAGYELGRVQDVVVTLRYTAVAGDTAFTNAVTGLLRPYVAYRYLDLAREFPDSWQAFLAADTEDLAFTVGPDLFPGLASRQVTSVYPRFDVAGAGSATCVLNGNPAWSLTGDRLQVTSGLTVSTTGSDWTLAFGADRRSVRGVELVLTYLARI